MEPLIPVESLAQRGGDEQPVTVPRWLKVYTDSWRERVQGISVDDSLAQVSDICVLVGTEVLHIQDWPIVSRFENMPLASTLPLMTVTTIMGTLYVSFVCMYIPAVGLTVTSFPSVAFHTAFVLALGSYMQGVVVDPGAVPDEWRPDEYDAEDRPRFPSRLLLVHHDPVERKKSNGDYRFCNKEKKFKPDRAHFCSAINRNVLRMDHFCPWLSNCVGYRNHKFFILCLFYTTIACSGTGVTFITTLHYHTFSGMHTFMMMEGTMLSLLMSGIVGPFFAFHCWLLSRNMTTIEFCEKRGTSETEPDSPWDVGLLENVQSIMGKEWYMWFLPIGGPPGNGLDFASRPTQGKQQRDGARKELPGIRVKIMKAGGAASSGAGKPLNGHGLDFLNGTGKESSDAADEAQPSKAKRTAKCSAQRGGATSSSTSCHDLQSEDEESDSSEHSSLAAAPVNRLQRSCSLSMAFSVESVRSAAKGFTGFGDGLTELGTDMLSVGKNALNFCKDAAHELRAQAPPWPDAFRAALPGPRRRASAEHPQRHHVNLRPSSPPRVAFPAPREPQPYPQEDN
mmetsp:Transcript_42571/g.77315  ORF Transcript_42571/g.77315 Transcript_42571/m.77315 type:complete len:566 (+) Transcript_42571:122-1819(+)